MNLVLVGRHSLDELQEFAEENFSGVENRGLPRPDYSNELVFDEEHSFGRVYKIIPNKHIKTLSLRWTMPASPVSSRTKSAHYLSHVIGHEGPNSLLSALIKASLATTLSSGSSARLNQSFDTFSVAVSLTDKGELEYERVIEMIYMYINKIRNDGPQEYIYTEMREKALIDFENLTKSKAITYSSTLARRMNYITDDADIDDLLRLPYVYEKFDEEDINKRLDRLQPENMWVIYHSRLLKKEKEEHPERFKTERWYTKDFKTEELSAEFKAHLKTVLPEEAMNLGNAPPN